MDYIQEMNQANGATTKPAAKKPTATADAKKKWMRRIWGSLKRLFDQIMKSLKMCALYNDNSNKQNPFWDNVAEYLILFWA